MAGVVEKLLIYPERMKANLERTQGLVHSQRVLLALTQAGVAREDSYRLVQKHAMRAWNGEGDLLSLLKADPEVTAKVPPSDLERLFDLDYHLKQVDTIFVRVFGK
jgi:adenylosuccinate lyase